MIATNVTFEQLRKAAREIGVDINRDYAKLNADGTRWRFRLVPVREGKYKRGEHAKYQRTSASYFARGRSVWAVCWHGHRDFFRALFRIAPEAKVRTSRANYTAENFESTFQSTDTNIGPQIAPIYYSEACYC